MRLSGTEFSPGESPQPGASRHLPALAGRGQERRDPTDGHPAAGSEGARTRPRGRGLTGPAAGAARGRPRQTLSGSLRGEAVSGGAAPPPPAAGRGDLPTSPAAVQHASPAVLQLRALPPGAPKDSPAPGRAGHPPGPACLGGGAGRGPGWGRLQGAGAGSGRGRTVQAGAGRGHLPRPEPAAGMPPAGAARANWMFPGWRISSPPGCGSQEGRLGCA